MPSGSIELFEASRSQAIEARTITGGTIDGSGHLSLTSYDGTQLDAGSVLGPKGPVGENGPSAPPATEEQAGAVRLVAPADLADWTTSGVAVSPVYANQNQLQLLTRNPFVKVRLAASAAIASNSVVPFDTVVSDDYGMFNKTTYAFTVPWPGLYRISGRLRQTTTGSFQFRPSTPGPTISPTSDITSGESALPAAGGTSYYESIYAMNANDTFDWLCYGAITASGAATADYSWASLEYLRPLP